MKVIAIDTETRSLKDKTMIAFSYCIEGSTTVVPVHMNTTANVDHSQAIAILTGLIRDENAKVVFHNSSFDIPVLVQFGVPFKIFEQASKEGRIEDTVIIANMVDENIRHGLKYLTKRYFKHEMTKYKEVCGTGKKQIEFADVHWGIAQDYAGEDAYWTWKLYNYLIRQLKIDRGSFNLYETVEKPLLLVVADMHIQGITVDVKKVKDIGELCQRKIKSLEEKLDITMGDVNFNSPKQLREYFIDKKNLPVLKTTRTGEPSVDKEVLKQYAENDGDAEMLLEYRKYAKIYSTFIPALTPDEWDIETWRGKIYASFNQAGTSSGRFSSSSPNFQNIPNDSKKCEYCGGDLEKREGQWVCQECDKVSGKMFIREAIIADKGHVLIGADYSQVELRILAHCSQDFNLMKAYQDELDIHQLTADACGVERRPAKTINFGLVYGMGAKTLSKRIDVTYDDAEQYIERYFDKYPGIKDFWNDIEGKIKTQGYIKTEFGRTRRRTIYFLAKDEYDQSREIRSITNAVIQGTAADMIKIAMKNMYPQLKGIGARIVSTVHDEVIVSAPKEKAKRAYAIVHRSMVDAGRNLTVPITVDAKIGKTWNEVH